MYLKGPSHHNYEKKQHSNSSSYCASLISSGFNAFWSFISNPKGWRICILELISFLAVCQSSPKQINFHVTLLLKQHTLFKTAKLLYWNSVINSFMHFLLNQEVEENPVARSGMPKCKIILADHKWSTNEGHNQIYNRTEIEYWYVYKYITLRLN